MRAERLHRDAFNAAGDAQRSLLTKLLTQRIAKGEILSHVALIFIGTGGFT